MSAEEIELLIGSREWCFYQVADGKMKSSKSSVVRHEALNLSVYLTSLISDSSIPVISLLKNSADWNMVEWACFNGRITHIPLNIGIPRPDLQNLLTEFKRGIVISDSERFRAIVNDIPGTNDFAFINITEVTNSKGPEIRLNHVSSRHKDMGDVLLYTSGSTGMAKGIIHTYTNLNNAIEVFVPVIEELQVKRALSFLPLSFSGERKLNYTYQRLGMDICYPSISKNLLDNILLFRPEVMGMVPSMLDTLLDQLSSLKEACPLKYIICGGATVSKEVINRLKKYGIRVLGVYGLTESASIGSANTLHYDKPGSAGKLLPGVEIRFGSENDISIHTDALFKGYMDQAPLSGNQNSDRHFHPTGDIGYLDNDGYLHITNRLDNKFKLRNGTWQYPEDIERELVRISDGTIKRAVVTLHSEKLTAILDTDVKSSIAQSLIDAYNQGAIVKLEDFIVLDLEEMKASRKSVKLSRMDIIKFAFK